MAKTKAKLPKAMTAYDLVRLRVKIWDITQEQLADALWIGVQTVRNYENERRAIPRWFQRAVILMVAADEVPKTHPV